MAGLGRRTFAAGEVLTASNVMGYLQDQAVMNFAGTAARGTALGTAVSEGMVSYLSDSNLIQVYDGSLWQQVYPSVANVGEIVQVVSVTKTDTQATAVGSVEEIDVTGLAATITPKSATNKILIMASVGMQESGFYRAGWFIKRGTTAIAQGDAAGSRARITSGITTGQDGQSAQHTSGTFLDSPATTSATTYKIVLKNLHTGTATLYVNRMVSDSDGGSQARSISNITLMEIVA